MSRCAPVRSALAGAVAAGAILAGAAACSSGSSGSGTNGAAATTALPSYGTVEDLAKQLEAKGITCKLEYAGLRQQDKTLSICVVNGEQATLTIWDKPDVLTTFLATPLPGTGATAVGGNWTIDVDTAANAQKLVAALGGTVKTAGAAPGSTA